MTDRPSAPPPTPRAVDPGVDPLDSLLRAAAPPPLADAGFTERTLHVLGHDADPRLAVARALVREQRRWDRQARLWRWAQAGVLAGALAMAGAMLVAPEGDLGAAPSQWPALSLLLTAGAAWFGWRQLRSA